MISAGRAASRREGERDGVGGGDVVALLIEDDPHQVEQRRGPVDHQDMLADDHGLPGLNQSSDENSMRHAARYVDFTWALV